MNFPPNNKETSAFLDKPQSGYIHLCDFAKCLHEILVDLAKSQSPASGERADRQTVQNNFVNLIMEIVDGGISLNPHTNDIFVDVFFLENHKPAFPPDNLVHLYKARLPDIVNADPRLLGKCIDLTIKLEKEARTSSVRLYLKNSFWPTIYSKTLFERSGIKATPHSPPRSEPG